jgi:GT2 family glycosyltransferase
MKLSVVIVNYNVEFFLEQCLHSVRTALKNIPSEVFVVDNNSVDGSVQMVKEKFPEVQLIVNKKNTGFSFANNQAIRISKGEYVLLLNPDTVVEEDTFAKTIKFMDEHPDAGGLGVKMLDGKGNFLPESKRGLPTPSVAFYKVFGLSKLLPKSKLFGRYHLGFLDNDKINEVDVLAGAFMMLRRSVLDKIGLLDETFFMYGEDIDISYRIVQAGYKNYYYPETRIIHYKGESTRKSSVNYVFVFYNAMIIFAQKHFSQNHAKLFSFLIHIAIYIRAGLALTRRFAEKMALPLMDTVVVMGGLFFIKDYYERNVRYVEVTGSYAATLVYVAFSSYLIIWVISIYLNGGYDKPIRLSKLIRGILVGTGIILIIYSLLPEIYRFSRALILFGAGWALVGTTGLRFLLHLLNFKQYRLSENENKRIVIVGSIEECDRVHQLLKQTTIKTSFVGYINSDPEPKENEHNIGNINQLSDYIKIYNIDEIIFCAKDIPARHIINQMLQLGTAEVDYKIAPPESLSVIGSNSIDTSGDLYTIDVNSITKPENRRIKRTFDMAVSLILLVFFLPLLFFVNHSMRFIRNIFLVLFGKRSWVGYSDDETLPAIRSGVLTPSEILGKGLNKETADRINMLYAKDYKLSNDFKILYKGLKSLGNG